MLLLLATLGTGAQSLSKQINDVKRSDAYLSAEATMDSAESAYAVAQDLLTRQIEEYVAGQKELKKAPSVIVKDVAGKTEKLQMNRGEMVRVFLYVKKSDIMAAQNTQILVQPANAPKAKQKEQHQPAQQPQQSAHQPQQPQQPQVAQSVQQPQQAQQPQQVQQPQQAQQPQSTQQVQPWQQAIVDELLSCANGDAVMQKLGQLRTQRKVKRFGAPDTCRKPADAFWVILDAEGKVQTLLGPATQERRSNFRTGDYDSLSNYSGQGAIWFTL